MCHFCLVTIIYMRKVFKSIQTKAPFTKTEGNIDFILLSFQLVKAPLKLFFILCEAVFLLISSHPQMRIIIEIILDVFFKLSIDIPRDKQWIIKLSPLPTPIQEYVIFS